jgi:hypothetical protein
MTCEVVVDIENDDYSGYKAQLPQGPYKYDELNEVQQLAIAVDRYSKMANAMTAETEKRRNSALTVCEAVRMSAGLSQAAQGRLPA